jgi:hypothetical protein
LTRLCRYVSEAPSATSEDDKQTVLNDLKAILNCKPKKNPPKTPLPKDFFEGSIYYDQWNPNANRYIEDVLRLLQTERNTKANKRMSGTFSLKIVTTEANWYFKSSLIRCCDGPMPYLQQAAHEESIQP